MFEQYPLTRYQFKRSDPEAIMNMQSEDKRRDENYQPMVQADFILDGYADVLNYIPCVEDAWYEEIRLQAFSHMFTQKDYFTERQDLDSYLILYTLGGEGILRYEEEKFSLSTGDIVWIDCRRHHYYRTNEENWEHCDLHISGRQAALFYDTFMNSGSVLVHENDPARFLRCLTNVLDAYSNPSAIRNPAIARALQELCMDLIEKASGAQTHSAESELRIQMKKSISFLHENFRSPISLDDMASKANLSKYHFSRCFRKLTGFAPNEYLIQLRLDHARMLLESTDLPIRTVGEMSGFADEAYFSRLFHQRTGTSARAYRKESRKESRGQVP